MDIAIFSIIGTVLYLFMGVCLTTIICDTEYFRELEDDDTNIYKIIIIIFLWPFAIINYGMSIIKSRD